jgi:integrase/recombinase XerD
MSNTVPDEGEVSEELREYLKAKSGMNKTTFKSHKSNVGRFEDWLFANRDVASPLDAEPTDVRDWLDALHDEGYSGSTLKQYLYTLRSFYDEWMESDGDGVSMLPSPLDENPANWELTDYISVSTDAKKQQYADNNEGVIYLSPSEIRELRKHVPQPVVRNELLIKMLVQTGLRRGELSGIKIEHLEREGGEGTVTVPAEVSKTDNKRTVPFDSLDPELSLWLDGGYRDHRITSDSPHLFITKQTEQLSPSRISSIVRETADNAGLDEKYMEKVDGGKRRRVTAHTLRATFIMRLLEAGIPTPKVMELSGHEHLETVENYANVLDSDAIDAYKEADIDFGTG